MRAWPSNNRLLLIALLGLGGSVHSSVAAINSEVSRHAPILVSRRDQINNPDTDRYLFLGYSILAEANGNSRIRYTAYFTDEDSIKSKEGTSQQMSRYGRRLDIEWLYEVLLGPTGVVKERKYNCPIAIGMGHRSCDFDGNFKEGTDHPILFNVAKHNIFSSKPALPYGSANGTLTHLEPAIEVPFPKSRDLVVVENPEFLRLSDVELSSEGKLEALSTEYAYVRVRGTLKGKLEIQLRGESNSLGVGVLKDLGLDLWGRESVVAIQLSAKDLVSLRQGTIPFRFIVTGENRKGSLRLEELGLYLITTQGPNVYKTIDLSSRIRCGDLKDITSCEI